MTGLAPYRSASIISAHVFRWKEIDHLLKRLGGLQDDDGWTITRNSRSLHVAIGNEDLPIMFDANELREIGSLLGRPPSGRLSVSFRDSDDGFEEVMAKGLAKAVAETWDSVMNDHMGESVLVDPPK